VSTEPEARMLSCHQPQAEQNTYCKSQKQATYLAPNKGIAPTQAEADE